MSERDRVAAERPTVPLEEVLRRDLADAMPSHSREQVRERVLAAAVSDTRITRARALFARSTAAAATTAVLLTGVGYAAANALPGDALYPVRRAVEEMRLVFSGTQQRDEALLEMTRERAREVRDLLDAHAPDDDIERATEQFGETVERAVDSQTDPRQAEETVRSIERVVEEEPPYVQEQVAPKMPAPSPSPEPDPGGSGTGSGGPAPDPSPDPDPVREQQQGDGSGEGGSGPGPSGPSGGR